MSETNTAQQCRTQRQPSNVGHKDSPAMLDTKTAQQCRTQRQPSNVGQRLLFAPRGYLSYSSKRPEAEITFETISSRCKKKILKSTIIHFLAAARTHRRHDILLPRVHEALYAFQAAGPRPEGNCL
jgi:hypothetical protein